MSDIQRYDWDGFPASDGQVVTYADHVEALRQARADGAVAGVTEMAAIRPTTDDWREAVGKAYEQGQQDARSDDMWDAFRATYVQHGYEQGQRVALAGAVQRVEALVRGWEIRPDAPAVAGILAAIMGDGA